jgi:hypothetical protein
MPDIGRTKRACIFVALFLARKRILSFSFCFHKNILLVMNKTHALRNKIDQKDQQKMYKILQLVSRALFVRLRPDTRRPVQQSMKRHTFKNNPSPDFFDSFINGISNMSVLSAIGVFGTVIAVSLAVYITVISPVVIFPSYFRADPTGLIRGNPLDVVLGDNLLSIDSTGLTATCPSGDTNLCTEITSINNQITVINDRLNITNGTSISASSVGYNGYQPYYTTNVTTIEEAADDTSVRLYDNVISISLTPSRFPALSFPTDQITVDEDIGRRLRLLETATPTNSTATTSLPAANITYTPTNSSNWNPAPTELQTAEDQLAARVSTLEHATAANVTLSSLSYTNGAFFMTNVSNGNAAFNNIVGELLVHDAQITTLQGQMTTVQGQTSQLLTRKNRDWHVSATYGNDATCDGSASLPCATASRTMLFFSNSSSQFAQNSIIFDNGFYSEPAYVYIPPNTLFIGNEIGTLLIFGAGAGLHPYAWSTTGTGFVTFLRFGLIRCTGAPCAFDTSTVLPLVPVFASFRFYNSTLETVTPFSFTRAAGTSSYFELRMESTVISGGTITLQDLTSLTWDLSGDLYTILSINYNYTSTYGSGTPTINLNGLVAHNNIVVNNFAPTLLVDWSLLSVILRDAATMTRNYVSGASINVHGDVLSLGSINGGLLSTGAGSGTTEYLTNAYGLGGLLVPQRYLVTDITDSAMTAGSSCDFTVDLNSGTSYVQGLSAFSPGGGSALIYNGTASQRFLFAFDATITYSQSATSETLVNAIAVIYVNAGIVVRAPMQMPIASSSTTNMGFTKVLDLTTSDSITMTITYTAGVTTTFTTCGLETSFSVPSFSLLRFTT